MRTREIFHLNVSDCLIYTKEKKIENMSEFSIERYFLKSENTAEEIVDEIKRILS